MCAIAVSICAAATLRRSRGPPLLTSCSMLCSSSTGGRVTSRIVAQRSAGHAIRPHRQVAVLLVQECVKTLVVAGRQIEESDERSITAAGLLQSAIDQRGKLRPGDLVRLE